jgi:hypothetical protein
MAIEQIESTTLAATVKTLWRAESLFAAIIALQTESEHVENLAEIGKEITVTAYVAIMEPKGENENG